MLSRPLKNISCPSGFSGKSGSPEYKIFKASAINDKRGSRMLSKSTKNKIIYMLIGLLAGLCVFNYILSLTNNSYLALMALLIVLAFWIGTLKVVLKREY
jgi:uncharacterized membrane protein YbjE (DUF340 family)